MPEASDVQALHAPSRRDIGLIAIGVVAVSTSAPIIAATAAPTMAIAFWRNALGALAIAPVARSATGARSAGSIAASGW